MDPGGLWRLAPAYDLTFSSGPGGEHYLDVEGEGRHPTQAHVAALGKRHGFGKAAVEQVIEEVTAAIAGWPRFADEAGVTALSKAEIAQAHAQVARSFFAAS